MLVTFDIRVLSSMMGRVKGGVDSFKSLQGVSQYFGHLATFNFTASEAPRIRNMYVDLVFACKTNDSLCY